MQNLQDDILQYLEYFIASLQQKQNKILGEVLAVEKKLNKLSTTHPQPKQQLVEEKCMSTAEETTIDRAQLNRKIEEMIENAEESVKSVMNPQKKGLVKEKKEQSEKLPQIEKKPPIPTVNRNKNVQTYFPKPYVKPKNEVTGKITQISINNGERVFKPEKLKESKSLVRENSNKSVEKVNKTKGRSSEEKVERKAKLKWYHFEQFGKNCGDLMEGQKKGNKKGAKKIIENLIEEYEKEEKGNRKAEAKSAAGFIKQYAKLGESLQSLPLQKHNKIQKRGWEGCFQVYVLPKMIAKLKNIMQENPVSEEYRMDPKEAYKIKYWQVKINEIMEQIIEVRSSIHPPDRLDVDFNMNQKEEKEIVDEVSYGQFYNLLWSLLNEIKNMDQLNKQTLRQLRMLTEIAVYEGKRSPVILNSNKYEEWRNYYLSDDDF